MKFCKSQLKFLFSFSKNTSKTGFDKDLTRI
nr:MAG TPA: hypothetical protein [Caudoviricetes sp.]